uniref:Uncharacterized protein n=1 Tax=Steinernema glaseri TaxID=37863 RepID=A0A1I7Y1K8_9BILA
MRCTFSVTLEDLPKISNHRIYFSNKGRAETSYLVRASGAATTCALRFYFLCQRRLFPHYVRRGHQSLRSQQKLRPMDT